MNLKIVKSLLLDRDGVINKLVDSDSGKISPQSLKQFEYIQNSKKSIRKAKKAGLCIYVFSNQPDVSKSWRSLDEDSLDEINHELREIGVDQIFNCTHGPKARKDRRYKNENGEIVTCDCRKPQSGLIKNCYQNTSMNPSETIVIGDKDVDVKAADRFEEEYGIGFKSKVKLESKDLYDFLNENLQIFAD